MKTEALKKLIKEAVREAIQEELKEVLLEAVKAPKVSTPQPVQESTTNPYNISSTTPPPVSQVDQRQKYMDIIGETALSFTSKDVKKFSPQGSIDTTSPNGKLPDGELGMDQIMNLMTAK